MTDQPTRQPANVHHLRVGNFVVTTLQDAYLQGGFGLIAGLDENEVRRIHADSRRPVPPRITLNCYLIDDGKRRILVDTGLGALAGDEGARMSRGLDVLGLGAEDIDLVLLTHAHPDHLGGLIDTDDQPVFANAEVWVPGGELDFWLAALPAGADDNLKRQHAAAQRVLPACEAQIRRLDGHEVLPGISRVPLPGHTPDHSGYRIESQGDSLLIWGDIVHLPHIQLARPEAGVIFDTDPAQATQTRRDILAEVAASETLIAGHHVDFPGIGHIVADGEGYRFLPHVWSPVV